jgi:fatty-acyl-CoA synthase
MGTSLAWITDSVAGSSPIVDPASPAVACDGGEPLSWGELRERELRFARSLHDAGIGPGDRVAMLLMNSVDYLVLYLALARIGAISVRLNFRLTAPEISFILGDSGSKLLVLDADLADRVEAIRDEVPVAAYVAREEGDARAPAWATPLGDFLGEDSECPPVPLGLDDPATLLYTSGTTGTPKGAIWTHGNSLWFGSIQSMKWKIGPETVALTPGPLFHAGGLEALLLPALVSHGTAITFSSGGFSLDRLLEVGRERSVTTMLLYSFMVYEFLRKPRVAELVPASLTRILCGGDIVMPWVYDELEKHLMEVELVQLFGLTEGGAICTCLDHAVARDHPASVGRPMPLNEVRVIGEDGADLAVDEVGEVLVRSPAVSPGFWQRPEATAEVFEDGWCHTGDLGRIDAEGFLSLAGRAKDMIRSGAENIYPAEVEGVLTAAPGVADAAVVGVPDAKYHEVGCAVLIAIDGETIDVEALRAFCAERLARYKIPKHIVIADELPRTASGKVKKYELRERYATLGEPAGA